VVLSGPRNTGRDRRQVGHQVRIRRSAAEFALYTVAESHLLEPNGTVRTGLAGMARLGPGDEFAATIDAQGPDPTRSGAAAEAAGELVERLTDGAAGSSPSPRTAATSSRAPTTRPNRCACS
jgi:hypothetical protein